MVIARRRLLAALAALVLLLPLSLSLPARAAGRFWEAGALLADMFPDAESVRPEPLVLDAARAQAFQQQLGYAPPRGAYVVYVARQGAQILGYALIDDQLGQEEPITFAVQLSPQGVVQRQEILVYRESHGEEVRNPRFRAQFQGKGPGDPVQAGRDVMIISGATYSSRAMAIGVKRAIVLVAMFREGAGPPVSPAG